MQNSRPASCEHRMLKALFVKSLDRKKFLNNNVGNARSLSRVYHNFEHMKLHGRLDTKKKDPSGKSYADNEVIESCVDEIVPCCSTTTRSMRCHCIRSLSFVVVKMDTQENNNDELVTLPVLHLKLSKAEMFDDHKSSLANDAPE